LLGHWNFDAVHSCRLAQAEVQSPVALHEEAERAARFAEIRFAPAVTFTFAPSRRGCSSCLRDQREPVIAGLVPVYAAEKAGLPIVVTMMSIWPSLL